ncbi:MAG: hypothetical protein QNK23_14375 [Crocinitomicaceae bacterium]|nr:hypothetical protein [Crocinitomicaceae bacterium]
MNQHINFQNKLNSDLWSQDRELHPQVKEHLIDIGTRFYNYLHIDTPLMDILFTGSLANVNWTEYSDIDLHIIIDYDEVGIPTPELTRDFFLAKKNVWNDKRNIFIKGKPVELYAQHVSEPHAATGQYSLMQDKWLVHPKPIEKQVDDFKVTELAHLFESLIDEVSMITDTEERFGRAVKLKDNIILLRRKSIELEGEICIGNLVFKELRNNGSLNHLFSIISSSLDKKLSLAEHRVRKLIRQELLSIL